MIRRTCRVHTRYQRQYDDPISFSAGEPVEITERTDNWDGSIWVWCTDARGKSGWVPDSTVAMRDGRGVGLVDYSAWELTAETGEILTITDETHGWLWCTNAHGESGWIPVRHCEVM